MTHSQGTHLRDVSLSELESVKGAIDDVVYRRANYVIKEIVWYGLVWYGIV